MTPKGKAIELREKFWNVEVISGDWQFSGMVDAKQCALIAVDEILSIKKEIWDNFNSEYFEFWQQVKTEIDKL